MKKIIALSILGATASLASYAQSSAAFEVKYTDNAPKSGIGLIAYQGNPNFNGGQIGPYMGKSDTYKIPFDSSEEVQFVGVNSGGGQVCLSSPQMIDINQTVTVTLNPSSGGSSCSVTVE